MRKPALVGVFAFVLSMAAVVGALLIPTWSSGPTTAILLQHAETALERGDTKAAHSALSKILAREPYHARALILKGHLHRQSQEWQAALHSFEQAQQSADAELGAGACFWQGVVFLEQNFAAKAERAWLHAIHKHPNALAAREQLVKLYRLQLRNEEARSQLDALIRVRTWTAEELVLYFAGAVATDFGDTDLNILQAYVAADPTDVRSALAVARHHIARGQLDDARKILEDCIHRSDDSSTARLVLAEVLVQQEQYPSAFRILEESSDEIRPSTDYVYLLANIAMGLRQPRIAEQLSTFACELEPLDARLWNLLGKARQQCQRPDAKDCFANAMEIETLRLGMLNLLKFPQTSSEFPNFLVSIGNRLKDLGFQKHAALWDHQVSILMRKHPIGETSITIKKPSTTDFLSRIKILQSELANYIPDGQEVTPKPTDLVPVRFQDVAVQTGIQFEYYNGQSGQKYMVETYGGGVAVLDFDQDNLPDLYFPQGCPLAPDGTIVSDPKFRDCLFQHRGTDGFREVASQAGAINGAFAVGATAADFDNDGDADLFVTCHGRNRLWINNGDGTFTLDLQSQCCQTEAMSATAAFADFNGDGNLDLYVTNYLSEDGSCYRDAIPVTCHPRRFPPAADELYYNNGDGTFKNVSIDSGIAVHLGRSFGIAIAEFTGDHLPDIYVANDSTANFLFENQSTSSTNDSTPLRFQEIGLLSGTALSKDGHQQAGMGVACADFDRNGLLDLYVTNFYKEYNAFYLQIDPKGFEDRTTPADLVSPSFEMLGFGTVAIDANLDGWQDLFVANGHVDDYSFRGEPWRMNAQILVQRKDGRFEDNSHTAGDYFQQKLLGRGCARLDWNGDLLPDLVVVNQQTPAALLENQTTASPGIAIELIGTISNRDGWNTRLTVHAQGQVQTFEVCPGEGFLSSSSRIVWIGIGNAPSVDRVEIRWPSGRVDQWENSPVGNFWIACEGHQLACSAKF